MNIITFPQRNLRKENHSYERMKDGLIKRGKYYHYVQKKDGTIIWRSTKQNTREMAKIWVEKNILQPLRDKQLGIKPITDIIFLDFADTNLLPFIKATKKDATYEYYSGCLEHLKEYFGELFLSELTPALIEQYILKRLRENIRGAANIVKKVSPATINKELTILGVLCKRAIKFHHLKINPVASVERLEEQHYESKAISEEDFKNKFIPVANPQKKYGITEIYLLGFYLGMRRGEILNLQWKDIDLKRKFISIWNTKTNKPRHLPMSQFICSIMNHLKANKKSEWVFVNKNGQKIKRVEKGFKAALKRAGLPRMRFHDLRHSFVSNCAEKGHTWDQTSQITGHQSYDMYKRYRHMFDQRAIDVVESFSPPPTLVY